MHPPYRRRGLHAASGVQAVSDGARHVGGDSMRGHQRGPDPIPRTIPPHLIAVTPPRWVLGIAPARFIVEQEIVGDSAPSDGETFLVLAGCVAHRVAKQALAFWCAGCTFQPIAEKQPWVDGRGAAAASLPGTLLCRLQAISSRLNQLTCFGWHHCPMGRPFRMGGAPGGMECAMAGCEGCI